MTLHNYGAFSHMQIFMNEPCGRGEADRFPPECVLSDALCVLWEINRGRGRAHFGPFPKTCVSDLVGWGPGRGVAGGGRRAVTSALLREVASHATPRLLADVLIHQHISCYTLVPARRPLTIICFLPRCFMVLNIWACMQETLFFQ